MKPEGKEATWEMKVSSEGSYGIITDIEAIGYGNVDWIYVFQKSQVVGSCDRGGTELLI